ncbi:CoA transferase [Lutimaribacter sp. EGI FJ00015]|uniref:CoA transferase n=1 Tax=Lutimaribacter degradans TaxID=2945989 RepID=A0ACC5ZVG9_9RHOB|nr:CoA transferase [Lutimaribacter sp. EGI FJ00013]MCM2562077.1 CoA transferase [Lutimaribacter sp. EGI FJ00013]MCO0613230.1 CoA transferase [Lutimaribacter sp. EGI FJ00015]MCO0636207.1 CoA transferase [Lutimaribacter sp. EGI FJ00014]
MTHTAKPLSTLRVLDFTRVLAGPYATALLADLGADVIKVESPGGDEYRHVGPFLKGESALFQTVNRGKRSIVLDLKDPADLEVAQALADRADVVIENFRPGVMDRLGLGAGALCERNPRLVYASVSGFGQTGPEASRPAYDIIVQAMSGLMDLTGRPDDAPTMVGEAVADVAGGLFASWGILAALVERGQTGRGRVVDISLADSLMSMMPTAAARVLLAGDSPVRTGNKHALSAPFGVYAAGKGHFAVAVLNDKLFSGFCAAIDRPELASDPRLGCDSDRRENEPLLAAAIESWAAQHTAESAAAALAEAGIPAAPLATAHDAWASDRTSDRELVSPVSHQALGIITLPEQPVHFEGSPRGGRRAAPALDEHGAQIRAELKG